MTTEQKDFLLRELNKLEALADTLYIKEKISAKLAIINLKIKLL